MKKKEETKQKFSENIPDDSTETENETKNKKKKRKFELNNYRTVSIQPKPFESI